MQNAKCKMQNFGRLRLDYNKIKINKFYHLQFVVTEMVELFILHFLSIYARIAYGTKVPKELFYTVGG